MVIGSLSCFSIDRSLFQVALVEPYNPARSIGWSPHNILQIRRHTRIEWNPRNLIDLSYRMNICRPS
jgi:hypothetical protein